MKVNLSGIDFYNKAHFSSILTQIIFIQNSGYIYWNNQIFIKFQLNYKYNTTLQRNVKQQCVCDMQNCL